MPTSLRAALSPLRTAVRRGRGRAAAYRAARRVARGVGDYRYLFVVTYGRSGSTLLMGLLNAVPGYRIRGENHNALYHLYRADAAVASAYERFGGSRHRSPRSSWYGTPLMRPHRFRAALITAFVSEVLRPAPGDRVIGFKEIRYTPQHQPDLAEYLEFLRGCFPGCRIVFNHRDPAAVARSYWWADVVDAETKVRAADERLFGFPADGQHFHFCYDRIDESLDHVRELFAFLGEPFDEAAVRAVLAARHGPVSAAAPGAASPAPRP